MTIHPLDSHTFAAEGVRPEGFPYNKQDVFYLPVLSVNPMLVPVFRFPYTLSKGQPMVYPIYLVTGQVLSLTIKRNTTLTAQIRTSAFSSLQTLSLKKRHCCDVSDPIILQ